ncbi:CaiB/BaiF CoA-transferase family protein [Oceanicola sp. 502str15]|uniref:CaiB/BaiF CoA transferase family protein n=1 Tax=Oceanicola sp. 502str15 TaxID=2696061 RepID=UPI002094A1D6|nr:CaiB/BaiF CoA-transferase family protein [Oceanicola sp. 502str15]MCO6385324.1 CoA transferase [Oceanicola sp. 502str15]
MADVTSSQDADAPLSHIKVLDLSRSLAGPWACQVFADFGADVIKCERPGVGDEARIWGPPFLNDADGNSTGDSVYFLTSNRGKRSITVNLSSPEGQKIIRALAADADVLVENYKVGDMGRFGLSYDDLKEINPHLVYCSISGFGQSGPRNRQAAYDFAIQGMSGLMSVTGEADGRPGAGPQKVGVPIVDIITGLYGAIGALVGLVQRGKTGKGDFVDVALLDCAIAGITSQVMSHLLSGKTPGRLGNRHPTIQPQDLFSCRDGDILIAVGNDAQYQKFCAAIGRADLAADERFITNRGRTDNVEALLPLIRVELANWEKADLADTLDKAGVPCSPINTIPEILADPQVVHRGVIREAPHPVTGSVKQVVSPVRIGSRADAAPRGHPALGQHVGEVLGQLGYSEEDIEGLKARGAI